MGPVPLGRSQGLPRAHRPASWQRAGARAWPWAGGRRCSGPPSEGPPGRPATPAGGAEGRQGRLRGREGGREENEKHLALSVCCQQAVSSLVCCCPSPSLCGPLSSPHYRPLASAPAFLLFRCCAVVSSRPLLIAMRLPASLAVTSIPLLHSPSPLPVFPGLLDSAFLTSFSCFPPTHTPSPLPRFHRRQQLRQVMARPLTTWATSS